MREKLVWSVQEVGEFLGISPEAVRALVRRGKLPARRWGRRLVFLKDELQAFFESLPSANSSEKGGQKKEGGKGDGKGNALKRL